MPQLIRELGGSSLQTRHHGKSLDLLIQIGLQEGVIVPEGHAAIRIAIWPKQKAVSEQAGAAKDFPLILGDQPQRTYPVEELFPKFKIVDIGRSDAAHSFIGVTRVIEQGAEAGMCFELRAVWHVNRVCGNIIDGSPLVITACCDLPDAKTTVICSRVSELDRGMVAEELLENRRENRWLSRRRIRSGGIPGRRRCWPRQRQDRFLRNSLAA